jgi:flagellar biosynthesis/type III secretory pathway protein FliH
MRNPKGMKSAEEWVFELDANETGLAICTAAEITQIQQDAYQSGLTEGLTKGQIGWRCFYCDAVFTDRECAIKHFGKDESSKTACQVNIEDYRSIQEELRKYRNEDTKLHRELARLQCEHSQALMREEEKGYAKGLADGQPLGRENGLREAAEECYLVNLKGTKIMNMSCDEIKQRILSLITKPKADQ